MGRWRWRIEGVEMFGDTEVWWLGQLLVVQEGSTLTARHALNGATIWTRTHERLGGKPLGVTRSRTAIFHHRPRVPNERHPERDLETLTAVGADGRVAWRKQRPMWDGQKHLYWAPVVHDGEVVIDMDGQRVRLDPTTGEPSETVEVADGRVLHGNLAWIRGEDGLWRRFRWGVPFEELQVMGEHPGWSGAVPYHEGLAEFGGEVFGMQNSGRGWASRRVLSVTRADRTLGWRRACVGTVIDATEAGVFVRQPRGLAVYDRSDGRLRGVFGALGSVCRYAVHGDLVRCLARDEQVLAVGRVSDLVTAPDLEQTARVDEDASADLERLGAIGFWLAPAAHHADAADRLPAPAKDRGKVQAIGPAWAFWNGLMADLEPAGDPHVRRLIDRCNAVGPFPQWLPWVDGPPGEVERFEAWCRDQEDGMRRWWMLAPLGVRLGADLVEWILTTFDLDHRDRDRFAALLAHIRGGHALTPDEVVTLTPALQRLYQRLILRRWGDQASARQLERGHLTPAGFRSDGRDVEEKMSQILASLGIARPPPASMPPPEDPEWTTWHADHGFRSSGSRVAPVSCFHVVKEPPHELLAWAGAFSMEEVLRQEKLAGRRDPRAYGRRNIDEAALIDRCDASLLGRNPWVAEQTARWMRVWRDQAGAPLPARAEHVMAATIVRGILLHWQDTGWLPDVLASLEPWFEEHFPPGEDSEPHPPPPELPPLPEADTALRTLVPWLDAQEADGDSWRARRLEKAARVGLVGRMGPRVERGSGSVLGGEPDTPQDRWPHGPGGPLDFVLQVDLADTDGLELAEPCPAEGVLRVFLDRETLDVVVQPTETIHVRDGAVVVWTEQQELPGGYHTSFPPVSLPRHILFDTGLLEARLAVLAPPHPVVQRDPAASLAASLGEDRADWLVLLEIGGIELIDEVCEGAGIYVCIRRAHLLAGQLEHAVGVLQRPG